MGYLVLDAATHGAAALLWWAWRTNRAQRQRQLAQQSYDERHGLVKPRTSHL